MIKIIAILGCLVFAGCATIPSDYDAKFHEKAKNIHLYEPEKGPDRKFEVVKLVKSNSCGSKSAARFGGNLEEATLLLRLEAATVDADAVVDYKCWTQAVDMVSNCWASKRCEGKAIKFVIGK